MKQSLLLFFLLLFLSACEKEEPGPPYFRFLPSDEPWFTIHEEGDTITFTAKDAPARKYVVKGIYDSRKVARHPPISLLGTPKPVYYYDKRIMELQRLDHPNPYKSCGCYTIQITRSPLYRTNGSPDLTSNKGKFVVSARFDGYNGIWPNNSLIVHNSLNPVSYTALALDGKVYTDVAYIASGNPNTYCNTCPNADPKYNSELRVDKVYYQKKLGVIKFSDLDGVTWQIKR
jgi:hypothetical protein